jgi:RNA polymerase sigma-70 factor, ECF subfamily
MKERRRMREEIKDENFAIAGLLEGTSGGSSVAFEQLYKSTSARLFGVCLRILHSRHEAEDVLQDTYIAIWRNSRSFDPSRGTAMAWLTSIAVRRAIDRVRSRRRGGITLDPDAHFPGLVAADATLISLHERRNLARCLQELEPKRRALLSAAFYASMTHEALSLQQGLPLGTVKSWIRRSLLQIRISWDSKINAEPVTQFWGRPGVSLWLTHV